jgi:hypothetical protein
MLLPTCAHSKADVRKEGGGGDLCIKHFGRVMNTWHQCKLIRLFMWVTLSLVKYIRATVGAYP